MKERRCFLKFSFLSERRAQAIPYSFNKELENMKTAKKAISPKKAKSLAKERSLPKKKQKTYRLGYAFLMKPRDAMRPSSTH